MENRKGNGIFLGIVSVATLVVAIIGATFAYFSASTSSNEDAVNLTAYEFKLSLSVSPVFPEGATSLIPLNPNAVVTGLGEAEPNRTNLLYALNRAKNPCIDDNKLQVCALYKVTITNQATNPITLGGQIRTVTNTPGSGGEPFTHLTYQSIESESGDPKTNKDIALLTKDEEAGVVGTATILGEIDQLTDIDSIYVPAATVADNGDITPGVGVGFVLVYLNDDTQNQSGEMGASYTGQLIYSSRDGAGSTLTGTFSVSGSEEEEE